MSIKSIPEYQQVSNIARKIYESVPSNIDLDDLIQAGLIGAHKAKARYVPIEGIPMYKFLSPNIFGAIMDELRTQDYLPQRVRAEGNFSICNYEDFPDYSEDENHFIDRNSNCKVKTPLEILMENQEDTLLKAAIGTLSDRLQTVISLYFNDQKKLTLTEIGAMLGVNESRVSQLLKDAVKKIQKHLKENE